MPTAPARNPQQQLVFELGAALLFLVISIVIAGESDDAGNLMVAVWATLLVLFGIHHFSK